MWSLKLLFCFCLQLKKDADCSNLNLRYFPSHLPSSIRTLDLSQNRLQNLTVESLTSYTAIRHLKLHSNQIEFVQPSLFRDMSHLRVLDLSRNSLDAYGALKRYVGPLPSVQSLDLSRNGLFTDMSHYFLRDAPALTNLSLNTNSITKICRDTFNGSQALRNIDLHNNVIIEIEEGAFESLTDLSELDLSVNSISCIVDFNLFQLKTLNLSKNSMSNFQTIDSEQDFELLYLDLRENKILYFPVLPRKNKLMYLDLSRNLLRSVNCSGPVEELENLKDSGYLVADKLDSHCVSERHQDLQKLMYLDLSYNQLKNIPSSFFSSTSALETLNISNNCLQSFRVSVDGPLNSLRTLDISFNHLQDVSLEENALTALEVLHLQGNALRVLDGNMFSKLPSIHSLHLQQNQLSICPESGLASPGDGCVSFASLPTLRYLYLSENSLSSVPSNAFRGSPLLILDLSLNPGVEMDAGALAGLEASLAHLYLRGNHLRTLAVDFTLFSKLKSLDLSANRLAALSLWSGDSSVESLNLQNNSLVTLSAGTVAALQKALKTLYVGSNPLSCCGNSHLLTLLRRDGVLVPDMAAATCWYSKDSQSAEISVSAVRAEHCESVDGKVLLIGVTVLGVLGLVVLSIVIFKLCHSRRHAFNRGIKA